MTRTCARARRGLLHLVAHALIIASLLPLAVFPNLALAGSTAGLIGTVTLDGTPIEGVRVRIAGNNTNLATTTDKNGRFAFSTLSVGTYVVAATWRDRSASARVELSSSGATVSLALEGLAQIGHVVVARTAPDRGSGTDLTLDSHLLARTPAGTSFPDLLLQMPGAARGANGVVHLNGDHGDVNYIVDGTPIPQELNRNLGTEFDLTNAAFVEILQGAYPAQYGEKFASVVNIGTRSASGPPGLDAGTVLGSYAQSEGSLSYHAPAGAGSFELALTGKRSDRELDPPNFDSPHDNGSSANQFLRLTLPHGSDFLDLIVSHSQSTFQIPNDVAQGEPSTTDDNETQDDLFGALTYHRAIGERAALTFGPSIKRSRIRDFGDPTNDFAFGEALNLAAGGSPATCATALGDPDYSTTSCAYSLLADRTATDYRFDADYVMRTANHEIHAGATYDLSDVAKLFAITLQPGNFLAPLFTPSSPAAAYAVRDSAPNTGHTQTAYVQDAWRLGQLYELDYGVRFDAFQLSSSQFADGAAMFSPRIKVTRFLGPHASVYGFFGRFFTPFSFENVSPAAAALLNLPLQRSAAAFDLRPQRDSDYEIGAHLAVNGGDLGLRVAQKNATDLIDDTQVGVTSLHQDINYRLGRIATQALFYQHPLRRDGRLYFSFAHTYSVNKGCETQLLAPCFGAPTDWTPADHDQRYSASGGALFDDRHDGWLSFDGEYGSGLSSAYCQPADSKCKVPPHTTFDLERGIRTGRATTLTLRVRNVLNDRYLVTFLNAQGNHYAAPRTFELGLNVNR